ncbi:hypothetical protein Taro_055235 [Colocasia esculenta]|uniref:Uncharacterized protein n=1 Tax=Colocasia esculenta TaxID=4460 RepID=A0A843XTN0_COLES|nr:hypothetical protein [Colocasia esculenta]
MWSRRRAQLLRCAQSTPAVEADAVTPRPPWALGPVLWVAAGRLSRRGSDRVGVWFCFILRQRVSLLNSGRARVGRRRRGGESSQQRQGARRAEETGRCGRGKR